ncbi:MAG: 2-oxoacid:ferredoxin oxidoreductase subunit beta [Clostridiales bacterium]|nr:2-oxoacid:ferredoxin oxidoreductase subunit beta [Clostridiales bacterium]
MPSQLVRDNLRTNKLPHIWCAGCSNGIAMRAISQAIENLGFDKKKVCIVSGIGCSSRTSGYMNYNTLHTTHGRAIAFATGVKLANPNLKVMVVTGDGDCSAIGGNHLIHAARRNIDITTIVFNNNIYGMTGGQFSPTTPMENYGTTAPYGNMEKPFDICNLAAAAGATYVARGTTYHVNPLVKLLEKAMIKKGFALVDVMSTCPTYYGRKNKKGTPAKMLKYFKDNTIDTKRVEKLSKEQLENKIIIGEFKNTDELEFTDKYLELIKGWEG